MGCEALKFIVVFSPEVCATCCVQKLGESPTGPSHEYFRVTLIPSSENYTTHPLLQGYGHTLGSTITLAALETGHRMSARRKPGSHVPCMARA